MIFSFVACDNPPVETKKFTVTFDTDGGSEVAPVEVTEGEKVTKPVDDPVKEGFAFIEWQLDGKAYNFDTLVTTDITLKAQWGKIVTSEDNFEKIKLTPIIENNNDFNDERANNLSDTYIILGKDITVDHLLYIAKGATATIDLNGHKIESKFEGFTIGNWGDLTIKDSSKEKSGIVCNVCKSFDNGFIGHDAIRNFGKLVVDGGTYGDEDLDKTNANPNNYGAALRNIKGATATIKAGSFSAGDNYWKHPNNQNGYSYAIRNEGELTVENWHVYGKMNGGVSGDAGTMWLKGGKVEITNPSSWHTLTVDSTAGSKVYISGGEYINNNTTYGHLFSAFNGMPSWEVTDLEANGYFVTGGKFIEDGKEKLF